MHAFALIILLIVPSGSGETMAMAFKTQEACVVAQAGLTAQIKSHNKKGRGEQISGYASACVPIKKIALGSAI